MIQTFTDDAGNVVQAIRLTGTESSARKVCHWLSISLWSIYSRDGQYGVAVPSMYRPDDRTTYALKNDWVVRTSTNIVEVMDDKTFKTTYERV